MRHRQVLGLLAACGGSLSLAAYTITGRERELHPVERAIEAALTERQHGRYAKASELLVATWREHPAQVHLLWEAGPHTNPIVPRSIADSARAAAARRRDPDLARCVDILMSESLPPRALQALADSRSARAAACGRMLLVYRATGIPHLQGKTQAAMPAILVGVTPWHEDIQMDRALVANAARALEISLAVVDGNAHPMRRVLAYTTAIAALHRLNRHGEAERLEQEAVRRSAGWGPGAELTLHQELLAATSHWSAEPASNHVSEVQAASWRRLTELFSRLDAGGQGRLAHALGMTLQATGRQRDAILHFERAAFLADSVGDDVAVAARLARVGRSLIKLGALDSATRTFDSAQARLGDWPAPNLRKEIAHDLLHLYEARGNLAAAVAAGRDFVRLADSAGTLNTRMMAHHDLAWLFRRNGRVREAEDEFALMIADIDTMGIHRYWAGEYFESVGQLELARDYYRHALTEGQEEILTLTALARVEEALGQPASAIGYARLADADTGRWDPEYAPVLPALLARAGRQEEARQHYARARRSTIAAGRVHAFSKIALESADLELQLGDLTSARYIADSAAVAAAALGVTELEVRARATAGVARARAGDARDALRVIEASLRRGDAMGIAALSAQLHLLHAEALRAAGRRGQALAAYRASARWLDSIAERLEIDASRALFRATHERVFTGALTLIASDRQRSDWLDDYLAWSIALKAGVATSRAFAESPGIARLAASLREDEALVDYLLGEHSANAFVVTRGSATVVELPTSTRVLKERVGAFLAPIAPRIGSRVDLAHAGFDSAVARTLYRDLMEPLLPHIGNRARLTIVPDEVLHLVPFDALLAPNGAFVVDAFIVRYRHSASASPVAAVRPANVIAVGPPPGLAPPGAAEELTALAAIHGRRLRTVPSAANARTQLAHVASRATILHFATHAEANDDRPGMARIAIGEGAARLGWLHASEIATWRLYDALIVLSACETAAGRLAGGQGTLSLSRAFLRAGAFGTVASLWPVGAPTTQLMRDLHQGLAAGLPAEDALRRARLALRSSHPLPFHWAAFTYTTR